MKAISVPKDKYEAEEERQLKIKNSSLHATVKCDAAVQKTSKGKEKGKTKEKGNGNGKGKGKAVKQKMTDMRTSVSPDPVVMSLFCFVTRTAL